MILSDHDIGQAMIRDIDPLIVNPPVNMRQLQPASLELLLHHTLLTEAGKEIDLRKYPNGYPMRPREFILGCTVETVHIPTDLVAQVNGKSSWARKGLIVHTTAGFVDPGFRGQITLEFANLSSQSITLHAGACICQLVFYTMTSPARRPYGTAGLGSHYQGQRGPTPSAAPTAPAWPSAHPAAPPGRARR